MAQEITITIKGGGLEFQRRIDEATAGKLILICLSPRTQSTDSSPDIGESITAKKESPAEYMNRHAPKRNPDKILVLAGYIKTQYGKDTFHSAEIKSLFRVAGEVAPANFPRDFQWVISNGWIAQDGGSRDSFYITNTGLRVLDGGFPEELVEKSKGKTNRIKSKVRNNRQNDHE